MEKLSSSTSNTLVIEIVAHEKRLAEARALGETVQAEKLFVDNGFYGEWNNHHRAWKHASKSHATHALILQDDAVPVDNFREHVLEAIDQKPDEMLSLYVGTHRPRKNEVIAAVKKADTVGASWLYADTLMWGVGVVLPVNKIREVLDTVGRVKLPYDQRLGRWALRNERKVYYTWPSLVDHADLETVAHNGRTQQGTRVAHRVGVPAWNDQEIKIESPYAGQLLASVRDML